MTVYSSLAISALVLAGCSGSSSPAVTCGPGTSDIAGQCTPSGDASVVESGGPDSGDSGASDSTSAQDAERAGEAGLESGIESGLDSGAVDAEPPADPCPMGNVAMPVAFDCEQACCLQDPVCAQYNEGGIDQYCAQTTCGNGPYGNPGGGENFIVRTPNAPGTDAQCASQCPSGGYVYGMGFSLNTGVAWWLVQVGPPWEIVSLSQTPYCTDSNAVVSVGCAAIPAHVNPRVYIMTRDPNAPARNITFTQSASTKPSCPADGG